MRSPSMLSFTAYRRTRDLGTQVPNPANMEHTVLCKPYFDETQIEAKTNRKTEQRQAPQPAGSNSEIRSPGCASGL